MRKILPLALFGIAAFPVFAAGGDDPLAWVPANAAAVGSVRLRDLKSSPITRQIFDGLDRVTVKGDAARFIEESGLRPGEDLESVTLAGVPKSGDGKGTGLVIFTGRFDPDRLAKASVSRGAIPAAEGSAVYYRITDKYQSKNDDKKAAPKNSGSQETCAVAFISPRLILAGPETAVVAALKNRAAGGAGFLDGALGHEYGRISSGATAWALVDVARLAKRDGDDAEHHVEIHGDGRKNGGDHPERQIMSAMRSVTVLAAQTEVGSDRVSFSVTGLSPDEETRGLIEDTVRGLFAAWRLAAQDKEPELVSVIRKFEVKRNFEGVTISGVVPGDVIDHLKARAKEHEKERKVAERNEKSTR
jgi:hypothetical protein